ncbi:tetratricopeptide repeat protein [Solwaraspora sp. WMMB762]|uniref:tetratricopeptide repeat protein n=1 Tax=Solwaraspora sp. WMMB762 TaxID=3404120 RepID=UPI003B924AFC
MAWQAYEQGLICLGRRDVAAARAHLESAGADPRALLLLGQLAGGGDGEPADHSRARRLYARAAALGSADAAYNLAALYATGRGGDRDDAAALTWYLRSAELGSADARRMVGLMYAHGQGVPADDTEAERHWRAAAVDGQAPAMRDLGALYAQRRDDPAEAAFWYLEAAKSGDTTVGQELARLVPRLRERTAADQRARTLLGVILAFHLDDPTAAVPLLTASAGQGDPVAQRTLGFLVERGIGADRDAHRAAELYRSAADAGDGPAAFNLAVLHPDSPEAVTWLRRAATNGVVEAYPRLGDRLSEQDLDEEALRWYVRGADAGDKGSMLAAACWYRDGFGGPVDLVQALRWCLAMLDVGSGDGIHEAHGFVAQMSVDDIHEAGRLSGRLTEADLLAQRSAPPGGEELVGTT